MSYVLIVDDEPSICWGFEQILKETGHDVAVSSSAEDALKIAAGRRPDAIVMDVRLPGMDGLTAIGHFKDRLGDVPIVVITAFGNLEIAVQAVQNGAFDYLHKPFDLDQAVNIVESALASAKKVGDDSHLDADPVPVETEMIGSSAAMQQVFKQIAWVANSDVPVLITGESGTGKELVARAIHRHSHRREAPFLPVCLAALNEGTVESELFGHVKGAFTGATHDRKGLLEIADGGTVFLDEIADTTPALQVKLLRALEQRELTPVGDARSRQMTARVVAATNRPLAELIQEGAFREDLFFRLSVFQIELPPLRHRRGDIPALAARFAQQASSGSTAPHISEEALEELTARNWQGNVRELRNAVEHAVIVARSGKIQPEHLPPPAQFDQADGPPAKQQISAWIRNWAAEQLNRTPEGLYEEFLSLIEPPFLEAILEEREGNKAAAAQILGIHRSTLRQKIKRYGLETDEEAK